MPNHNINIHYNIVGNGEPILFLHGLGSQGIDWEPQANYLKSNYKCILPDLRGHGKSDKPKGEYSIRQMADDISLLMKSLDCPQFHVVGISMGGAVAFQMAIRDPETIKSMVIINSISDWRMKTLGEKFKLGQRKLIVRLLGMRKMGEVLAGRLLPKPEHESLRLNFIDKWAKNDTNAYLNSLNALVNWSLTPEELNSIKIPTLLIASDLDYAPVEKKEKIVSQMPCAELKIITDARHGVTIEHPKQVNTLLESFFEKINSSVSLSSVLPPL
ncbi:MAG: alpha/beta hydrolase [Candidatus Marinimicrobia bacterium]|jgi:pimeloyl-ACP methyl ester carboxylesterase|nr:alpha/beta hydrolase [Candidatus Neomarinimicrobiota bacterium]MBT3502293.1 alpha/beta hydrolase [Candidatus Neomarinimicrobiota bacterium]MBT3840371.1 alpha/beta hydrolase [Candidatus Neomarinimicrobiota bacterium]MBT3998509.1 alpha/beta hydrolase [Candidatus Neomarinimicrobiota bacterium]MBT4578971.1 alpha/beta hydrolase [Candidatus Neomarinimicrobiota bacterium]